MSLCQSIDTLAMAYLDDELVVEERRELELHVLGCESCREHVETERAEIATLRQALAPPPAPDLVLARIARALDAEDQAAIRAERRRPLDAISRWLLPGSAISVASVAIFAFAFFTFKGDDPKPRSADVAKEVIRQNARTMPLEVQGAGTRPWLRENFAPIDPPAFQTSDRHEITLLGARLTAVSGHNAAQLRYLVTSGNNRFTLTAVVIDDLSSEDLTGGTAIKVGDRTLHIHDANGMPAVTYVDEHGMGYAFASERLRAQELFELVVSSDLIGRAQQGR
jgi:anti-sigma factor RsiW